jgi:ATP-dependent Lhr-like helicase
MLPRKKKLVAVTKNDTHPPVSDRIDNWFAKQGWGAFPFQRQTWQALARGRSGLVHATTGAGKTYALWLGALAAFADTVAEKPTTPPLTVVWLTPMRALGADTLRSLQSALDALNLPWTAGVRTGDTPANERASQGRRLPSVLITTPESLSLLLARADATEAFSQVKLVVADEWHELLGTKRGVQVQLALARLRRNAPGLAVWGLSATLGNLPEAMDALLGPGHGADGVLVQGKTPKRIVIDTLLPPRIERFPWAGHLGLAMLPAVIAELEQSRSTLVFINTRSQAERWYQALLAARPDWAGDIALHHGSMSRESRDWVELGLKNGLLRAVVSTSSLDLGVDFLPVERVLQIGSPKGIARLLQRAGRSGHAPGRPSRVTLVPTHSLELVEAAASRAAAKQGKIESRRPPEKPLDVLVQHLVTIALGGGFVPEDLLQEVRQTHSYRNLTEAEWQWALDFVTRGGASLAAYPDYRRVAADEEGVWRVPDARLARRHRMSIGTIVSDATMRVKFWGTRGGDLGSIEEGFIARLKPGDAFLFAGRLLELVRTHEMTAYVKPGTSGKGVTPRWNGSKMPLSSELARAVVEQLDAASKGVFDSPEMKAVAPLLAIQADWSALPVSDRLLAETWRSREGTHLFLYPFAGRHVHLGVASLLAWRAGKLQPASFSMAVNDYGLELLAAEPIDWAALFEADLFATDTLMHDVVASLNASELAQRRFREIARVSGLIFQGFPGAPKSTRQLQASSGLFFDVFRKYDPDNLLLAQADAEVLRQELDLARLEDTLARLRALPLQLMTLKRPSPFAFPLLVERFRERLSTEKLADRIARMVQDLERAAGGGDDAPTNADVQEQTAFGVDVPQRRARRPKKVSRPLPLLSQVKPRT